MRTLTLSGRQRALHQRLVDHDRRFGMMYLGAIEVLESDSPDRLAQAAHSCRELVEKLVRLRAEPPAKGIGNPRDRASDLQAAWEAYRTGSKPEELAGEPIDAPLLDVLQRLELFCEARRQHKPRRRIQVGHALEALGLIDIESPDEMREVDIEELAGLWQFFERASHHSTADCTEELVVDRFRRLEALLMRWVPETFADLDEIDALLGGRDA